MSESETETNEKRVFGDRYVIERKIARGGMADVYLAKDQLLDRPVALKVLFPELSVDPTFVERFRREAQNAARLNHPNIVSVYDWGEESSTYYIVMEYLDGKSLSTILRQDGKLSPDRSAQIGLEMAAALSFAHKHGVVHRDVKPGNVLIDSHGAVKVTDFGIARARNTTENLTQTGAVMGTATYFSPEQAQGHEVDQRSDVYSLGVVLYEMVAGKPPFQGDNPVTIAYKHVRENPVPLREVDPLIPTDYESIVAQAMTKSPVNRYASAEELRADLARFCSGQSVTATRVAPGGMISVASNRQPPPVSQPVFRPTTTSSTSDHKEPKGLAVPLMIFVSLLAAIAIGVVILYGGVLDRDVKNVQVPNVIDKTLAAAQAELEAVKLSYTVTKQASDKPENTVIGQNPGGGGTVPSTQQISLTVSSGPAPSALSDYTNQNADTVTKTLQRLGIKVETKEVTSDEYDKGRVVSQDPAPGETVSKGKTVTLTVSTGPEQVEVPDVTGYTIATASQRLSDIGLRTALSSDADSSVLVVSVDPKAGTKVAKGSTITLTPQQLQTTTTTSSTVLTTTTTATVLQPSD